MSKLSIAVIQSELKWEDCEYNLQYFRQLIKAEERKPDLIILPETFSTGFTMNVKSYADGEGKVLSWMEEIAKEYNCAICGSVIVFEKGKYYNRLYFVSEEGLLAQYDKRHLFRMGREDSFFTQGTERVIVCYKGCRIILQTCYDLRFPVFVRNRGDYDMIIYVANWPTPREDVWEALLVARAIENQSFVVGANRCGIDGEGIGTCGKSAIIDAKGKKIAHLNEQAGIIYQDIDLTELSQFRMKFPVYKDADKFDLK